MSDTEKKSPKHLYVIVFLAVLVGFAISQYMRGCSSSLPSKVHPYVNEADKRSHDAVDESLEELNAFFAQAKTNARLFADVAVGWGSKWRLILDYVDPLGGHLVKPFVRPTKGLRHETYLKEKFNEMIFSDEQLAKIVEETVAGFFRRLESIDSKMLVDIRADLPDLAEGSAMQTLDEQTLLTTYRETIQNIQRMSTNKTAGEIGAATASVVAGEVLAMVAVRLAVSSGILGAGAASSWATLGVGVIVGVIVDYIVAKIWDWYADPKGTLAAEIVEGIDNIQTLLIDGTPATDLTEAVIGLRARFADYARQRQDYRKAALQQLLKP